MSIVTCKKCAARYEGNSKVCPVCGAARPGKRNVLVLGVVAVMAFVLFSVLTAKDPVPAPQRTADEIAESAKAKAADQQKQKAEAEAL